MKIKDVLAKVAKGEDLSADEKKFLAEYEEPSEDGRIPKERLDREIAKRADAEKKLADAQQAAEEARAKLDELESKGLSAADKQAKEFQKQLDAMTKRVESLTAEKEATATELAQTKFRTAVSEIAGKNGFLDADYLGFVLSGRKIDMADAKAVDAVIGDLKKSHAALFKAPVAGGSGGAAGGTGGKAGEPEAQKKYSEAKAKGDVISMLEAAPPTPDTKKE